MSFHQIKQILRQHVSLVPWDKPFEEFPPSVSRHSLSISRQCAPPPTCEPSSNESNRQNNRDYIPALFHNVNSRLKGLNKTKPVRAQFHKSGPSLDEIRMPAGFGPAFVSFFEVLIPRKIFETTLCTRYALRTAWRSSGKNNEKLVTAESAVLSCPRDRAAGKV